MVGVLLVVLETAEVDGVPETVVLLVSSPASEYRSTVCMYTRAHEGCEQGSLGHTYGTSLSHQNAFAELEVSLIMTFV